MPISRLVSTQQYIQTSRLAYPQGTNLQDLPGALTDAQVAEGLGLSDIKNRDWAIFKTSAIKGEGLFEGLDWLSNMLKTRRR